LLAETLISLGNCRQTRFKETGISGPHLQLVSSSTYDHTGCGKALLWSQCYAAAHPRQRRATTDADDQNAVRSGTAMRVCIVSAESMEKGAARHRIHSRTAWAWSLPAASRSICAKLLRAQAVAVDWGSPIGGRQAIITE